jgi:hypothetical protein
VAERNRRTAEELLVAALETVGLMACDLSKLRKNDSRKQAVAWLLEWQTPALRWGNCFGQKGCLMCALPGFTMRVFGGRRMRVSECVP